MGDDVDSLAAMPERHPCCLSLRNTSEKLSC